MNTEDIGLEIIIRRIAKHYGIRLNPLQIQQYIYRIKKTDCFVNITNAPELYRLVATVMTNEKYGENK